MRWSIIQSLLPFIFVESFSTETYAVTYDYIRLTERVYRNVYGYHHMACGGAHSWPVFMNKASKYPT